LTGFVADASVGVAWVVFAQSSEATDQLLGDVSSGVSVVVPVLWPFETTNTLLVLARRKRLTSAEFGRAAAALAAVNAIVDDDGPRLAFGDILDLAMQHGLSVYDAAYLEVAIRRRLPLASRDSRLNGAAKAAGIQTLL